MNFCEPIGNGNPPVLDLNSPDSINEGALPTTTLNVQSPHTVESNNRRHPSPYYYGDLFKYKSEKCENSSQITAQQQLNGNSNNKIRSNQIKSERESKLQNTSEKSGKHRRFRKSSSLDNPLDSKTKHDKSRIHIKYRKSSSVDTEGALSK